MSIISTSDLLVYLGKAGSATGAQRALAEFVIPFAESTIKEYLGFSVEQQSYTQFLPEADLLVTNEPQRLDVVNNRVVVDSDGDSDVLFLPERPVRSITSVNEDYAAYGGQASGDFSGTDLTSGIDYYLDYTDSGISWSGKLYRITGVWPAKRRTIKITYVAGLSAGELDGSTVVRGPQGQSVQNIRMAAILTAAQSYIEAETHQSTGGTVGAIKSERLADYSVTYADESIRQFSMNMRMPPKARELLDGFRRLTI